jgi:Ca2+/H+ antiporter
MDNKNDTNHSGMMWVMMIGCLLLPVAFIVFAGRGFSFRSNWFWFVVLAIFFIIHIWMMFKRHNKSDEEPPQPPILK